jgi:cellulose synthase/poly-beta-1,6-N-acetylglucosamine synthase-like glycosyltransferase
MKYGFWLAAAFVVYTYIGYPAWLCLRMLWRTRPVVRGANIPYISIVMVVRDEERVLEAKLGNLHALDYPQDRCEIVVVSDGSTDRTEEILHGHADDARMKVVLNQLSQGKAAALNDAAAVAQGEILVFTDARQMVEPGAVRLLLENFADPDVGCASGELMLGDPARGESGEGLSLYWRTEKRVREMESASGSAVGATGALYAVRSDLMSAVPQGTILDDVYVPMNIAQRGKRVVFDPRARVWDIPNLGAGREFSRKVRTLSGNYQLLQIAPWLLTGNNPLRFEFVSHKLSRLVAPFALALMLAASAVLRSPFYRGILLAQIIFYALSAISLTRLVRQGMFARIVDAPGTFVMLNCAAVVALANFLSGRRAAWR